MRYDFDRVEMLPFVPTGARTILDVGCDTGRFGALLRSRIPDAEIWGIDPAEFPNTAYDERLVGSYPDDLPTHKTFDCVVFNDVLEHMIDPWSVLQGTAAHLAPHGVVVASIPNVRHKSVVYQLVLRGDWRYAPAGILDSTHLRFFTRSSIRRLFEDSGMVIDTIVPINVGGIGRVATLNRLTGGRMIDFLTLQFAVVARHAG